MSVKTTLLSPVLTTMLEEFLDTKEILEACWLRVFSVDVLLSRFMALLTFESSVF